MFRSVVRRLASLAVLAVLAVLAQVMIRLTEGFSLQPLLLGLLFVFGVLPLMKAWDNALHGEPLLSRIFRL